MTTVICEKVPNVDVDRDINSQIKNAPDGDVLVKNVAGHRYIGNGTSGKAITIEGTPGNALGAYLNGSTIIVNGNAQDAVGDTMNCGSIVIHGNAGDTVGYGMRDGKIFIKGNAGYRSGIHMKEYQDKVPLVVIGGKTGNFLGEYQAGGTIIVLGLDNVNAPSGVPAVGGFCATGQHGGRIYIRSDVLPEFLPVQVICADADDSDKEFIKPFITEFVEHFSDLGQTVDGLLAAHFFKLTPNSKSPYKQLYVNN
ncbi:MAG: glutamate synthase [Oscillospiraceae bacterium]|nr:glutamate synthase [Oscillospiraceae bacterium]